MRERSHHNWVIGIIPASGIWVCDWVIPELSAAGLIVPDPSVTPSPFAVWAEYIAADADGAVQRREARQVFRLPSAAMLESVFLLQRVCAQKRRIEGSARHAIT
jgi:hypothetical protein